MADCLAERMVVTRVGSRAVNWVDYMAEKTAVNWV